MKTHRLHTISDIAREVTEENIDVFISDFKQFLQFHIELKQLPQQEGIEVMLPTEFRWTDDGVKGCTGVEVSIQQED